nr:hypothetical protein [Tanacetum cinerariifolium]
MAIDKVGWDWSYMANEEENHTLVADDEAPTEFALMAKSSSSSKNEIKKEKEGLDSKLTGFESASKDLDTLVESQRSDKNKEGLGYSARESSENIMSKPMIIFFKAADSPTVIKTNKVETVRKPSVKYAEMYKNTSKSPKVRVLFPPAQVYSPPKKDMSWTGLPEFADDTITDYSRPSPCIETDSPTVIKTNKVETVRKPSVKYAEMYKNTSKSPKFDHLAYDCGVWVNKGKTWPKNNYTHKNMSPRNVFHKTGRTPIA